MNTNYKTTKNEFKTDGDVTLMTILKKNGTELSTKIDTADIEKVQNAGTWFAEWHKDFNSYLVQSISSTKTNKKAKPLKQSLQTIIMDVAPTAPVKHINGDTLDNRKSNLQIFNRNEKNEFENVDGNTVAVILKDKYGNVHSKALISPEDLHTVINDNYSWVSARIHGKDCVVANTPEGRIHLDKLLMDPMENQVVHHINLNPLDNRRKNLELHSTEME